MLNKRWITLPVVNSRPFASKANFWAILKDLSSPFTVPNNRVLKWWRHKNEISEIMGFVRIFWKKNVQEAYLLKMSISGQIVSKMLAGYTQKTPYKPF